ncbi:MAG TPA: 3-isopropylmalate dehydratase large subunit, partial [Hellea balneolensis]|nr:3-isopropylmalate dehydratase large subunit [Hellea balneolensis]
PQAFQLLADQGLGVRRPDLTLATIDHSTPTRLTGSGEPDYLNEQNKHQVETLLANTKAHNIVTHGWGSDHRGVIHVMAPELGAVQPGMTIVCGDSHTSTHGAFGALAFGIGTTQVGQVLATQCILMRKPKSMRIHLDGSLRPGVSAKDVILAIIAKIGVGGGTGFVLEYTGECFEAMNMDERMTVCNMSIEAGARAGLMAPDGTTIQYLKGRNMVPDDFGAAADKWLALKSDADAQYDKVVTIDARGIQPMVTYGTHPGMAMPVGGDIPTAANEAEQKALDYMQITSGLPIIGETVNRVFIGSCTNARLTDLRTAANIMSGHSVAKGVEVLIVPGSEQVKAQAEAEGLHEIFIKSGAQWREPGCSMCIAMNGDKAQPGELVVSTSNRNFAGRQGPGARTVLASPATAAAAAIHGKIMDPRQLENAS